MHPECQPETNDQGQTADGCLLYYITDRTAFAADEAIRRKHLLAKISEAALAAVDYIQLREKDLSTRDLELLAVEASAVLRKLKAENPLLRTALLINSRTDVALAAGADGVHLRSDDISPTEVKEIWTKCGAGVSLVPPLIGVSAHSAEEIQQAKTNGATFAVFAPVFEKRDAPGTSGRGLSSLREACRTHIPVLALGGVTLENASSCLEVGAAGIAAIRLFQENDISAIAPRLRAFKRSAGKL